MAFGGVPSEVFEGTVRDVERRGLLLPLVYRMQVAAAARSSVAISDAVQICRLGFRNVGDAL